MSLRVTNRIPNRRPKARYWLRRLLIIGFLIIPTLVFAGWHLLYGGLIATDPGAATAPRVPPKTPIYVLVLGVDERPEREDPGRSDTMMLVRLSRTAEAAHVVSIPRDTLADIRGRSGKVNTAYSIGGPELSAQTVSQLLHVQVPYYVKVNLEGFVEIIDQLGGIDLDVERDYYYHDPYQDLTISLSKGPQRLTGEQALQYVRLRYDGAANDDISRIKRQQKFLQAVRERLVKSPLKAAGAVSTLRKHVTTNIPDKDQLALASMLFDARDNLSVLTLPGHPDDETGNWLFDRDDWQETMETWPQ